MTIAMVDGELVIENVYCTLNVQYKAWCVNPTYISIACTCPCLLIKAGSVSETEKEAIRHSVIKRLVCLAGRLH